MSLPLPRESRAWLPLGGVQRAGANLWGRCVMSWQESMRRILKGCSASAWLALPAGWIAASSPVMAADVAEVAKSHTHQLQPVHHSVALFYCVAIVLASVFGGVLPKLVKLTHGRLQVLISFVGGLMLGISVFHLLPHALVELGTAQLDMAMIALMCGMVAMFLLLRMFHFHDHGPAEVHDPHDHDHDRDGACGPAIIPMELAYSGVTQIPSVTTVDSHAGHAHGTHRELSWMGVCFGLSVHSLLDGVALGASMQAGVHTAGSRWVGFGTFLAILLHKPLDSVSIAVLMRQGKCPSNWRLAVNLLYSLMCPLGAIVFLLGFSGWTGQHPEVVGYTLAFAAGVFLCISLGDLLPEMEFHSHHRIQLTAALLAGIIVAWGIRMVEDPAAHEMKAVSGQQSTASAETGTINSGR